MITINYLDAMFELLHSIWEVIQIIIYHKLGEFVDLVQMPVYQVYITKNREVNFDIFSIRAFVWECLSIGSTTWSTFKRITTHKVYYQKVWINNIKNINFKICI